MMVGGVSDDGVVSEDNNMHILGQPFLKFQVPLPHNITIIANIFLHDRKNMESSLSCTWLTLQATPQV